MISQGRDDMALAMRGGSVAAFESTRKSKNSRALKPFDQLQISPSKYGRSSAVDVPRRYALDASLDEIFQNANYATFDRNGQLSYQEDMYKDCIVLNCSFLLPASVEYSMYQLENYSDMIYSITVSESATLPSTGVEKLLSEVLVKGRFSYLVELDLSYVSMSQAALELLCKYVNPVAAGYCPLRRLIATRCGLGAKGSTLLLAALRQNTVVEEMFLSGNAATDLSITALILFLKFNRNAVSVLGLGDNQFTADGMARFSEGLSKQLVLTNLQLNGNPIGDYGSDSIFTAIGYRRNFESLNLSSCGINSCSWAGKLSSLLSLSSLFLAHNSIDDQGLQALSLGLRDTCCLRHLDLSYNTFGLTPGSGLSLGSLGSIIKLNRLLTVLVMSGNCMLPASWSSVAAGLFENESLLSLDVTYCELTLSSAEALCRSLEVNQTVKIDMRYNDLPDAMLSDPRRYQNAQAGASRINPKWLLKNVQAVSLLTSQDWRVKRAEEVQLEITAADIIREQDVKPALQQTHQFDDGDDSSMFNVSASVLPPSTFGPQFSAAGFGHGYSVHSQALLTAHGPPSPQKLTDATSGDRILTVTYGHVSTILGVIIVRDDTTYTQAKELVKPLVRAYLGANSPSKAIAVPSTGDLSVEQDKDYGHTARPCRDYSEDFDLLAPAGQTIAPNLARVRNVWGEAAASDYMLMVQPAGWISLSNEGDRRGVDVDDSHIINERSFL